MSTVISENDVEEQLGREEAAVLKTKGKTPLHKVSASSFLALGLELEESQCVNLIVVVL